MSDEADSRDRPRWTVLVAAVLVIAAYQLSMGPMFLFCEAGFIAVDNPFWTAFYSPLVWIVEFTPIGEEWFSAYLELWGW